MVLMLLVLWQTSLQVRQASETTLRDLATVLVRDLARRHVREPQLSPTALLADEPMDTWVDVLQLELADGTVLAQRTRPGVRLPDISPLPPGSGPFSLRGDDEVERFYVRAAIPGTPWQLVASMPRLGGGIDRYLPAVVLGLVALLFQGVVLALGLRLRRELRHSSEVAAEAARNAGVVLGAMQGSRVGMALLRDDLTVFYVNPALADLLGQPATALLGTRLTAHLVESPGDAAPEAPGLFATGERRYRTRDGRVGWADVSLSPVARKRDEPRTYIVQIQDVSERHQAEMAREALLDEIRRTTADLHAEKELLQVTLASLGDAVLATDADGAVRFLNPVAERLTGWTLAQAQGRRLGDLLTLYDPEQPGTPALPDPLERCRREGRVVQGGLLFLPDGERRELRISAAPVRSPQGESLGAVLVCQDVTESRELQRRLSHQASHDTLTGLLNRSAFLQRLDVALHEAGELAVDATLVYLDLDRFQLLNDSAGHAAGDALLRRVASLLAGGVRAGDVVARLGGDEFGMILRGCHLDEGQRVMESLLQTLAAMRFTWDGRVYTLSASAGLTAVAPDVESPGTLLRQADVACDTAKGMGRNRVSVYRAEQGDAQVRQREIELAAGLREAIEQNRFTLYAQRIVDCRDPQALRYEILLRLRQPDGTLVSPGLFVPAAERYDLMGVVDRWVLRRCLVTSAPALLAAPAMSLHLNVSANSLSEANFAAFVLDCLREGGLPPERLTLEVTETALISSMETASSTLARLRQAGCSVALDDFGIGLSSFGYLRSFPVDFVKIDGSFVRHMLESQADRHIVQAIHDIARSLGAATIAEFVESEALMAEVTRLGIDHAQGYGLHEPEPLLDLLAACTEQASPAS